MYQDTRAGLIPTMRELRRLFVRSLRIPVAVVAGLAFAYTIPPAIADAVSTDLTTQTTTNR